MIVKTGMMWIVWSSGCVSGSYEVRWSLLVTVRDYYLLQSVNMVSSRSLTFIWSGTQSNASCWRIWSTDPTSVDQIQEPKETELCSDAISFLRLGLIYSKTDTECQTTLRRSSVYCHSDWPQTPTKLTQSMRKTQSNTAFSVYMSQTLIELIRWGHRADPTLALALVQISASTIILPLHKVVSKDVRDQRCTSCG